MIKILKKKALTPFSKVVANSNYEFNKYKRNIESRYHAR